MGAQRSLPYIRILAHSKIMSKNTLFIIIAIIVGNVVAICIRVIRNRKEN